MGEREASADDDTEVGPSEAGDDGCSPSTVVAIDGISAVDPISTEMLLGVSDGGGSC